MNYFIISAFGKDQTGIVAVVTTSLNELSCNIEDSSMTRLKDEFAMLITISVAEKVSEKDIRDRLEATANEKGLFITLKQISKREWSTSEKELAALSVHGGDQLGIVAGITALLQDQKINICDLCTTLTAEKAFIMHFDLELPATFDKDNFEVMLKQSSEKLGVVSCFELIERVSL